MRFEELRVLLVDAEGATRRQVAAMLQRVGILACREANSGLAALERLRVGLPDLLMIGRVSDCGDGIAFLRQVREIVGADLPVILVAGYADLWRLDEARQAGANEFLVRPFTTRALTLRIQRALAARGRAALRAV